MARASSATPEPQRQRRPGPSRPSMPPAGMPIEKTCSRSSCLSTSNCVSCLGNSTVPIKPIGRAPDPGRPDINPPQIVMKQALRKSPSREIITGRRSNAGRLPSSSCAVIIRHSALAKWMAKTVVPQGNSPNKGAAILTSTHLLPDGVQAAVRKIQDIRTGIRNGCRRRGCADRPASSSHSGRSISRRAHRPRCSDTTTRCQTAR